MVVYQYLLKINMNKYVIVTFMSQVISGSTQNSAFVPDVLFLLIIVN